MANTKLDMGVAWTTATGLIGANKDTISAIAGLFFFLPSFAAALFIPEASTTVPASGDNEDPAVAMQAAKAVPFHCCVPEPPVTEQTRTSLSQSRPAMWKVASQVVAWQAL
jgi:hypothetical protein